MNEAFAYAKKIGNKIMRRDFAMALWPNSRAKSAHANLCNLCNGKTKKVDIEAVPVICTTLGVTSDYLFGLSPYPTKGEESDALREKIAELNTLIESIKALI